MNTVRVQWVVVLAAFGLLLSACGGGGSSEQSPAQSPPPVVPTKTLSWSPPTAYTDNTTLNPTTDLDFFEIYVKENGTFSPSDTADAVVSAVDPDTHASVTSFNLGLLAPYLSRGVQYHVSVRAVTTSGMKSDFSPSATFSL